MDRKIVGLVFSVALLAASAAAQTNVTTISGGTAGTVPVFTSGTNVENSPISISGGNVGIGTTAPWKALSIGNGNGGTFGLSGIDGTSFNFDFDSTQGNYLQVMSEQSGAVPFAITGAGNVGVGTVTPNAPLEVVSAYSPVDGSRDTLYLDNLHTTGDISSVLVYGYGGGRKSWEIGDDWAANGGQNLYIYDDLAAAIRFYINSAGDVGIGTTSPAYPLDVSGQIRTTGGIVFPDGSIQSVAYAGCTGGDYAESMDLTGDPQSYAPGDVLVLDADNPGKILKSSEPYATTIAGIYSTKPGFVGRRQTTPKTDSEVPMAMVGVVPTMVSAENGPIKVGDLLVSSTLPGYAMKGTDRSRMLGAVIGKAMASLDSGTGTIEVLVSLQ